MTSVLSRAPLRIGLAGGGTDIKDFYEIYGGKTLSVAIDRYVYCKASISNDHNYFCSYDRSTKAYVPGSDLATKSLPSSLKLHQESVVWAREIAKCKNLNFNLETFTDIPIGSGLGTSSTIAIAIIKAIDELLGLHLKPCELAEHAYSIERDKCGFKGGRQTTIHQAMVGLLKLTTIVPTLASNE